MAERRCFYGPPQSRIVRSAGYAIWRTIVRIYDVKLDGEKISNLGNSRYGILKDLILPGFGAAFARWRYLVRDNTEIAKASDERSLAVRRPWHVPHLYLLDLKSTGTHSGNGQDGPMTSQPEHYS